MLNPYQPNSTSQLLTNSPSQRSNARAVFAMFGSTMIGYFLPFMIIGSANLFRGVPLMEYVNDIWRIHSHFNRDGLTTIGPNIGCATLFGLSAIATYVPKDGDRFTRSLMKIGGAMILGLFLASVAAAYGLGLRTYTSDPYMSVRIAIAITPPIIVTFFLLLQRRANTDEQKNGQ